MALRRGPPGPPAPPRASQGRGPRPRWSCGRPHCHHSGGASGCPGGRGLGSAAPQRWTAFHRDTVQGPQAARRQAAGQKPQTSVCQAPREQSRRRPGPGAGPDFAAVAAWGARPTADIWAGGREAGPGVHPGGGGWLTGASTMHPPSAGGPGPPSPGQWPMPM